MGAADQDDRQRGGPHDTLGGLPAATTLVVPVKSLSDAKSRLQGQPRSALMRGFALDALAAALACPLIEAVHLVTDAQDLAAEAEAMGCRILPDHGRGDLNRALVAAVTGLREETRSVAALLGDLPCLSASDLTAALAWSAGRPAFVADAAGTGTTLLTVGDRRDFRPHFGAGSAAAHARGGFLPVPLALPGLRHDVDTADELASALRLGVGEHTRAAVAGSLGQA